MNIRMSFAAWLGAAIFLSSPLAAAAETAPANGPDIATVWQGQGSPSALVRNPFVRPTWIGSTDSFWYRRDSDKGHDFRIVDVATGQSRAAFD